MIRHLHNIIISYSYKSYDSVNKEYHYMYFEENNHIIRKPGYVLAYSYRRLNRYIYNVRIWNNNTVVGSLPINY